MLKRILAFAAAALFVALAPVSLLHAQARKWVLPPNIVDFSASSPTAPALPGPPSTVPYRVANGAFDSAGKLLFYVKEESSKLEVFDGNGNKVDQLANAADSLQIAVVPVPLSCDQKYYILYFTHIGIGPHSPLILTYSVFDIALGAITARDVQVPPSYEGVTFRLSFGTSAVTPLRSNTTRFLYAVNNNFVDKFLIDPSGVSWVNKVLQSVPGFFPVQSVLSPDGSKLAVAEDGKILVVTLDSLGDFDHSEVVAEASPSGLAFSRDGSTLFFGNGGTIDYVRLADPLSVVPLPDSGGYGHSQLQLAVNDRIYAADSNDFALGAIDPTSPVPSFTPSAVPNVIAGNYFEGVLTLPAQIDGEPLCGNPALVQSTFGLKGNFEVVVPSACGGLAHYWRDNDSATAPWYGPNPFGATVGAVDAVSMIQSRYGNLEVVARIGDRLAHFWRGGLQWHGPFFFASGVSGTPSLVQGSLGSFGNFELVTPLAAGGLAHYQRDNDGQPTPWHQRATFGGNLGIVEEVTLIQSTLGLGGPLFGRNLEAVVRVGDRLAHFWSGDDAVWHEGGFFAAGVSGTPSLIQGNYANPGGPGNFELVTPLAGGGMAHYWRNGNGQWSGPSAFSDGNVRSVSLIQSNYGQNFEVVARRNCSLVHYWRSDAAAASPWTWFGTGTIIP